MYIKCHLDFLIYKLDVTIIIVFFPKMAKKKDYQY